ncbi:MAG: TRAP transporter small permease subunit [Pseudomonadota bacterium]
MTEHVPAAASEPLTENDERLAYVPPESGLLGRTIHRLGPLFAAGFVVAMAILIMEIVLRYVFDSPTLWAHEATIFLCAVNFVFGGLYCAAKDRHIRVVLIYDFVPKRVRRVLDVVISLTCAASAGLFAWASVVMVQRAFFRPDGSFRMEGTGSAWDPPTPALVKGFLFAVLIVLCVQFLILAWNHAFRRHED